MSRMVIKFRVFVLALAMFLGSGIGVARAQTAITEKLLTSIVEVIAEIPADARTARFLGARRQGSGIVIDGDGLVLTIGYLILEASSVEIGLSDGRKLPARVIAYDHETGLGLVRANMPLGVAALQLGDSDSLTKRQQVLVASHGGVSQAAGGYVMSRRDYAAAWEYMLENAIFTAPPHPRFGGAALIDGDGKLIGVGSLLVPDAAGENIALPGNMFVPINVLKPILGDLLANGRSSRPPRPWLGLYTEELRGRLFVTRVPSGGPAYAAGLRPGDMVLGIEDKPVAGLKDFYRRLWSLGRAGVEVSLIVLRGIAPTRYVIKSIDRRDRFRAPPGH
jgi:S1-C subfamily serine protease